MADYLYEVDHIDARLYLRMNKEGKRPFQKHENHENRVVNTASKLIGNNQKQLSSIYKDALKRKSTQILYDPAHPLNQAFQKLPSGRRLKVPLAKKNLFKKSFVPSAILILNAKL